MDIHCFGSAGRKTEKQQLGELLMVWKSIALRIAKNGSDQVLKRLTSSETRIGVGSRGNDVKAGERVGMVQFTRRSQKGIGSDSIKNWAPEKTRWDRDRIESPNSVCGGGGGRRGLGLGGMD